MADRLESPGPPHVRADAGLRLPAGQGERGGASGESAAPRATRRSRRFAIPDSVSHLDTEKIEAFFEGPAARSGGHARGQVPALPPVPRRPVRLDRSVVLDSRADWNAAFRLETARHGRYGRPAAVAVIDLVVLDPSGHEPSRMAIDNLAAVLGQVLRLASRETDRVARVGPTRFNVLLPETSRAGSRRFAERARRAGEAALSGGTLRVTLRIAIAAPSRDESLADALADAEAQLHR